MGDGRSVRISKFLSLVLRHEPERMKLVLDDAGWTPVDAVLHGFAEAGLPVTREDLEAIVRGSDKQRFAFSDDGARLRANQGHSIDVELGLPPSVPPPLLFHGTVAKFLDAIRAQGLKKGERHHVHLSAARATAEQVGGRRGRPVVLEVLAAAMALAGHAFFLSANGVWLTEHVPASYLVFPEA
jgi:putative RNA 2'-phosphotransferase